MLAAAVLLLAAGSTAAASSLHHDLRVRLEPETRRLVASDRLRLRCPCPGTFALLPRLAITQLTIDGVDVPPVRTDGQVQLPPLPGPAHAIRVRYRGRLDPPPLDRVPEGSTMSRTGTLLATAAWYPIFADLPFTYTLRVDVPASQRAVTAGRLEAEAESGGRWRARYASDGPAEDLTLVAGPWAMQERQLGPVRMRTWLHPEIADLATGYLDKLAFFLDLYSAWIGPYPYSAFHVVSVPFPAGLGFPAMTVLGTSVLRLPFIRDTSLGHEVLHAWWGNGIAVDEREGNWAEALTTFMADYTFVEWQGPDAARELRRRWLGDLTLLAPARDVPLAAFRARRHTAEQVVGYHKGALVFLMLRDRIGAEAFTEGLRRFAAAHRFRRAGWSDLRTAFEAASGQQLSAFFAQWVQRPGAPRLRLEGARTDGRRLRFVLAQERPPWSLEVPVLVETTGAPLHQSIRLSDERTIVTISVREPPRALEIDPDARVLRRLARDEVPPALRHVTLDPSTRALVLGDSDDDREAARLIVSSLLESPPSEHSTDTGLPPGPLVIAGTTATVSRLLAAAGLDPAPAEVSGRGSGRAWATWHPDGSLLVIVSGDDAAALRALARPLPHVAAASWVVFAGARVLARGSWPVAAHPLRAVFSPPSSGARPAPAGTPRRIRERSARSGAVNRHDIETRMASRSACAEASAASRSATLAIASPRCRAILRRSRRTARPRASR